MTDLYQYHEYGLYLDRQTAKNPKLAYNCQLTKNSLKREMMHAPSNNWITHVNYSINYNVLNTVIYF